MNTKKNKKPYIKPEVKHIRLDNEISLVMQSTPGWPELKASNNEPTSTPNPFRDEESSC